MRMCVFDRVAWTTGLTLELKLARFLRQAWADLGWTKKIFGRIANQDLHKTASAMNKNQMQTCHASIQKQIEETTWHTLW